MLAVLSMVALWVIFMLVMPAGLDHVFNKYEDIHARALAIVCVFALIVVLFFFTLQSLLAHFGEDGWFINPSL